MGIGGLACNWEKREQVVVKARAAIVLWANFIAGNIMGITQLINLDEYKSPTSEGH